MEKMQKNMNMNMFFISLEAASSAVKLGTVLQRTLAQGGALWITTLQKATLLL